MKKYNNLIEYMGCIVHDIDKLNRNIPLFQK